MSKPTRAALIGAAIAALITLPGLAAGTLWDNSETAYGEVAREILLTHDWVVMHFNLQPWFVQPPLYFWVGAIFAKLLGAETLSLRLPAALATIAMGGMTAYAVTRQAGSRAGIFASVILSTSLMQAVIGRLAIMDALLDLAVALTIFWWFRALQTGQDRYFVYGWIAVGFGFLAKGPVAPAVALMVIVPYAWWNWRSEPTHIPSWRGWLTGLLAFFVIVAPWFIALAHAVGGSAVQTMIGHYTFGRYTGVIENQSGPVWYYLPVIILGFFPWIAFLPVAIVWAIGFLQRPRNGGPDTDRLLRLAIVWIVVPLIFFSFAKTKLPNYLALEFPGFALLTGLYFDAVGRKGGSRAAAISAACVPVFIGGLAIAIVLFSRHNKLAPSLHAVFADLSVMGIAIFIGAIVTAVMLARNAARPLLVDYAPYALGVAMLFAVDTLALFIIPQAEMFKPIPPLARIIDARLQPGDAIAIQGSLAGSNALLFYTRPPVLTLPQAPTCPKTRTFFIGPSGHPGKPALFAYSGLPCKH